MAKAVGKKPRHHRIVAVGDEVKCFNCGVMSTPKQVDCATVEVYNPSGCYMLVCCRNCRCVWGALHLNH